MSAPLHHAYAAAAIAFAGTLALTPAVRALCIRLQILDVPGPLKIHKRAVPRLGGAAIFIAIFAATICSSPANGRSIAAFLAALTVVWLAGFIDDLRNLSPAIRVAAQLVAGTLIWTGGWQITLFGNRYLGFAAVCLAAAATANAINLFDGLDALASGTTAIIAIAYLALPHGALSPFACVVAASVAASCLGFLPYNWPTAKIFLGDQGSTVLGFTIAFLAVDSCRAPASTPPALAFAMLAAAVPLLDAVFAAIRRLRSHRSALLGDRGHLYDLELARSGSVLKTLACLYGITAALCLLGLLLVYRPSAKIAAAVAAVVGILGREAIKLGSIKRDGFPETANLPMGRFDSASAPKNSIASSEISRLPTS
jgi:UDP-GlcNAc:undecaprenyl-phosphate/decaprenyl-phosphate GlcNAc-1-phosphate transferase